MASQSCSGAIAELLPEIRRQLMASRRFRFEQVLPTRSGREGFFGFAVSNLYDKAGRPLGYILIFQDLTEIQALENEVRLKERMAALGEMAAGMAHELRNPLAAISGSVQYLKGTIRPEGESLELMDIILRESWRLDGAIRDFLTFARPGRFAPEPVDVAALLSNNVKLLRKSTELAGDHRIELELPESGVRAELDPNRLKQIFWNLSTNALKAMPDGGVLRIAAQPSDDGQWVEIDFADEGVGMTQAQQESYFQPFASSFREGTGLGAAIVYRLVEEHGGRIQVDSGPGQGTRITVTLPSRQAQIHVAPADAEPLRAAGGQR